MLFLQGRKRQQEMAQREAAGENLWTSEFSNQVRVEIKLAASDAVGYSRRDDLNYTDALLLRQYGQDRFTTQATTQTSDLIGALRIGDDDRVADVVEALCTSLTDRADLVYSTTSD